MSISLMIVVAELLTLGATFLIKDLAGYLEDEDKDDPNEAARLVGMYCGAILISVLLRNWYIYQGYIMSIEIRKILSQAVYDKVGRMSMRSLTETNSGKLITLTSGDIMQLERPLTLAPYFLASPFINLFCYILIW